MLNFLCVEFGIISSDQFFNFLFFIFCIILICSQGLCFNQNREGNLIPVQKEDERPDYLIEESILETPTEDIFDNMTLNFQ